MENSPAAPDPVRIEAIGGGENQAAVAQKRSQNSRPMMIEKNTIHHPRTTYMEAVHSEREGSHPRLSGPAWSSEICEIARAREQLENPASAVQDTRTTGEKPLQQFGAVCGKRIERGKESEELANAPSPNTKAIRRLMAPSRMTTRKYCTTVLVASQS
ncbi:hypothetical protein PanWU01x14_348350 [Parasponia andersonii]|uniref:Uncharacterized protein n=1 Tax=Parasponia andersonii TaxID=3476 RepID=A0A2P5ABS9_PARAD|nr:hypothetical protein PanWU01x14_348350 [Parasponia andersonii]